MDTKVFQDLSDQMYNAILDDSLDTNKSLYQKTLRAIRFVIDYLCTYIQFQGSCQLEYEVNGGQGEDFTEEEKIKYIKLSNILEVKALKLRDDLVLILTDLYIKMEDNNNNNSKEEDQILYEETLFKIQEESRQYLEYIGHTTNSINLRANLIFNFLINIAHSNQIDNQRKFELRHNYGGAIMFLRRFFIT